MYIETSSPRRAGDVAVLFTPVISSGQKCMTFFYHMYGPHISSLRVYSTSDNRTLGTALWGKNGTQGNVWLNSTLTVGGSAPFQVAFQGTRGISYQGDIAIDDVSFKDGPCATSSSGKDTAGSVVEEGVWGGRIPPPHSLRSLEIRVYKNHCFVVKGYFRFKKLYG